MMTTQTTILQLGEPRLRIPAQAIDDFTDLELQELLTDLHNMMVNANGVGIAAPQIGISKQIIIIASRPTSRYPLAPEMPATTMINPSYSVLDASTDKDWEGCLSVPGIRALVPRFKAVEVSFNDQLGQQQSLSLSGFPARVFQHEFDHLLGLVYLDRVENNRDIISESEYLKLIAAVETA